MATNPPLDWSELVPDVLSLIYKRLSFSGFARAKTVCSSWYSVSTPRKNHVPWLIFNEDRNWQLFNPEEGKFYRTQINIFADCRSLATCGNWVLVTDEKAYLYIFNPFTLEIIHLPPLESYPTSAYKILGNYSIHLDYGFGKGRFGQRRSVRVDTAVLWVDERTKDYLVVWTSWGSDHLCFCRKGDEEWIKTPTEYLGAGRCVDMAYKDKKLYILLDCGSIRILDFSEDFPRIAPNNPYVNRPFSLRTDYVRTKIKLTTSGDVVLMIQDNHQSMRFEVYKMNNTNEEWERVDSLEEEEALVWDLSVTLPTKGVSGIKKDSIYLCDTHEVATYDIPTQRIEPFRQCSHLLGVIRDARWFVPCFGVGE